MTPNLFGWWLAICCVALLSASCTGASSGGTGGIGGVGATGGTGGLSCDESSIQACLDLQDCCRAILINPVFFQSCNSVVLQCDRARCLELLAGYPQCAPEPEIDAGTPDAG
jgi:hypothetical protein